jgi:hypothetical protein
MDIAQALDLEGAVAGQSHASWNTPCRRSLKPESETSYKHFASKYVKGHENQKRFLAQRRCMAYAPARAR